MCGLSKVMYTIIGFSKVMYTIIGFMYTIIGFGLSKVMYTIIGLWDSWYNWKEH
jgi:uncharacterized membrane protein YuzA (DUF378 family)